MVILDDTYSKTKIQEILKDETNYNLTDANIDNNILKITKFSKIHNNSKTKKDKNFLKNYISIICKFYGLPKFTSPKK